MQIGHVWIENGPHELQQQIETFVHVAEHGSFSKAALVLGSRSRP